MTGEFFAIGKEQWTQACALGLNVAAAYLVLARGTGRDNITSRWSAQAVEKCAGISWRRADAAIKALERANLAVNADPASKKPTRKLVFPKDLDQALWLPNTLVDGVSGNQSPVARLRQAQSVSHLQAFIDLYGVQDLAGDGGLPRSLVRAPYSSTHVCDAGQFRIYGFRRDRERTCVSVGPLARFHVKAKPADREWPSWEFLRALERMGLLETVDYLAEGVSEEAELIHPLTGDSDAQAVSDAAEESVFSLPEWVRHTAESFDYVIPVIRDIPEPSVVGISRLTFRPHTRLTAAWWSKHRESCERFARIYQAISSGDYKAAIAA